MFKCIALLKGKPELTRDQLIDYYETRHAPLIRRLLPGIISYRRNFIQRDGGFEFGTTCDFDVVTELGFADRESYDRFVARSADPDVARQIAEDEENVFDRSASRMYIVDERTSSFDD